MKTPETQKLTETQKKVHDYIEKYSDSNADFISNGTELNKLLVLKSVKALAEKGMITINLESQPATYCATKLAETDVKLSDKKSTKTENTTKVDKEVIARPKTGGIKKETVSKQNDEVVLTKTGGRDTSKLKFNGELYGKGRLVLAVVKKYVEDNPKTTLTKLKEVFPSELQPRYGMFQEVSAAKKMSADRDRFFLKPEDLIKVGDKKVAVCNQFGSHNLPLKHLKSLGFVIK